MKTLRHHPSQSLQKKELFYHLLGGYNNLWVIFMLFKIIYVLLF